MRIPSPRYALRAVARLTPSKQCVGSAEDQKNSKKAPEARFPVTPSATNNEICVLDDNFAEEYHEADDRTNCATRGGKSRFMQRLEESGRALAIRRQQFVDWKSQATDVAVKALHGCYALAQREVSAWRSTSKGTPCSREVSGSSQRGVTHIPRQRVSSRQHYTDQKCSRTSFSNFSAPGSSMASSLSSVTDSEEEWSKVYRRSEFSLRAFPVALFDTVPSHYGFAEMNAGSHERLVLIDTLPFNDSDEDNNEDGSLPSRHLPFRRIMINNRLYVVPNEWV